MNNGNPYNLGQYDFNQLPVVPYQGQSITPEQFSNNMAQIQAMKEALARAEQLNAQAAAQYLAEEQERQQLQAIAEQGRLAEQRLAQLNSGLAAPYTYAPPVAGPSAPTQSWVQPQYMAAQPLSSYNEVPSTARIVEVSQGSPQLESSGGTPRRDASQAANHQQSQPRYAQYTQTPRGGAPYSTAYTSTPQTTYHAPANATRPTSQRQAYGSAYWASNDRTPGQPSSSSAHHSANANPYSASQPSQSTSGQSSSTYYPSRGHGQTSQAESSGASSATVQPSVAHTTQSSTSSASVNTLPTQQQPYAQTASQQQQQLPRNTAEEQLLYDVFKHVPGNAVQTLMMATYGAIKRLQNGSRMTTTDWKSYPNISDKGKEVVKLLSDRMKHIPLEETNKTLINVYQRLRATRQAPTHPTSTSTPATSSQVESQPQQPQQPSRPPPATVHTQQSFTQPPPVSHGQATSAPQANVVLAHPYSPTHSSDQNSQPTHPPPSQSFTAMPRAPNSLPSQSSTTRPQAPDAPPSQSSTARPDPPSSSTTPSTPAPSTPNASTNGTPAGVGPVQWYKPLDPSAPIAFRNREGQIQFVFQKRSQEASASAPATQTVLSTPTPVPLQTEPQTSTSTPTHPATQGQQSTSTSSPQKADRRTLAHDIMRALIPLKGASGTPLPPPFTRTPIGVGERPTENGKRKPSPPPVPSTPSKRQRIEDNENDAQPDASIPVETKPEQADVTVAPLPPEPAADVEFIDLTTAEPDADAEKAADSAVDVEQTDRAETVTVRAASVTSSDAADAYQVQEAIRAEEGESTPEPVSAAVRTTKSPSLGAALEEVNRLHPSQDLDYADGANAVDVLEESIVLLSPTRTLQASTSNAGTSSPVPTPQEKKEKLPLFLPSRSTSPDVGFSRQASPPPPTEDDDASVDSSALPQKSFDLKGKGKARQIDTDVEMASSRDGTGSPRRIRSPRRSMAYVLAPPLPAYAKKRRSQSQASTAREDSDDELATSRVDEDGDTAMSAEDSEVQAAAELSYSRLRETPCQWAGCGATLNSTRTLQKHLALHAGEQDEWGSYACRWHGCLSNRFVDKVGLLKHLNRHALVPLRCAYEGCEQLFDAPDKLLEHHRSSKHRSDSGTGTLRASCEPLLPPARRRPLPPLPDVVPAYLSVPCRVSMHPLSKERHQWLGGKVLENIICFKWQGRRSNAAAPSRGSRRLAEKMAATELEGKTPAESLALIKRWIDGEYLDLTDGYDASRRHHLHCDEMGSGEVSKMVQDGLVLFSNEPEPPPPPPAPPALPDAGTAAALNPSPAAAADTVGPEGGVGESGKPSASVVEATEASAAAPEEAERGPPDLPDQLVGDVSPGPDGKVDAGGGRLELPRRSNIMALVQAEQLRVAAANAVAEPHPADASGELPAVQQHAQAGQEGPGERQQEAVTYS